ncbi:hypothetical protein FAM21834_02698 [Lentilactobacillus parabuchneri]|uniref:ribosomal-processing cysteine protease Prp n=1 Tax=Lentilactobacillus parabuchneri TaxID=152331 RepID=UPI000A25D6F7|nr:ribosomal-processing cysteine protease Prp [Lentilactobacillus parabuchneri]ORN05387.1 hypothetical protein FAM21834_02698 [Lentilactobacillus parabuchneri]
MIQIQVNRTRKTTTIRFWGHSGLASYGHDIVCSAISIMMAQLRDYLSCAEAKDDGSEVSIVAKNLDTGDERLIEAFIGTALQVEAQYPKNVKVVIVHDG